MKKFYLFMVISFIILAIFLGIYLFKKSQKYSDNNVSNKTNYSAVRTSDTTNLANTNTSSNSEKNVNSQKNTLSNESANNSSSTNSTNHTPVEELISEFSTKIYTKDSERQNNISITCKTLNNTIVEAGSTFSFCNTVGKATSSKGYQKADVYQNGEVVKALGGGNCQVSSTLYNAVLKVSGLKVTERHSHSNSVPYVSSGKDAAVAYGSYDFKFINNTGNKLKISSSADSSYVYIKLYKII